MPVDEFLSAVASSSVAPAAGTSVAVTGAIGAALCEMTCRHTVGKAGYEDVADEMAATADDLETIRERLLELADADAEIVDDLRDASDAEFEDAMERSTGVPLAIAEACLAVLDHAVDVTESGNENALADAHSGAILAESALRAALGIVRTNLAYSDDTAFVETIEDRVSGIEADATAASGEIQANLDR